MRLAPFLPVAAALALAACGEQPTPKPPLPSKPVAAAPPVVAPPAPVAQTPVCVPRPAVVCPSAKPAAVVGKSAAHRRKAVRHVRRHATVVRQAAQERTYNRVYTEDRQTGGYREGGRYERREDSYREDSYREEGYRQEGYREERGPRAGRSDYYAYGDSGAGAHYAQRYGWEYREGYVEGYRRGSAQGGPDRYGPGGPPPHRPPPPRGDAAGRDMDGFLTWPGKIPDPPID